MANDEVGEWATEALQATDSAARRSASPSVPQHAKPAPQQAAAAACRSPRPLLSRTFSSRSPALQRLTSPASPSTESDITYADALPDAELVVPEIALAGRAKRAADEAARQNQQQEVAGQRSRASTTHYQLGAGHALALSRPAAGTAFTAPLPASQPAGLPPSAFSLASSNAQAHRVASSSRLYLRPTRSGSSQNQPSLPPCPSHPPQSQSHPQELTSTTTKARRQPSTLSAYTRADRVTYKENTPASIPGASERGRVEEWRKGIAPQVSGTDVHRELVQQDDHAQPLPGREEEEEEGRGKQKQPRKPRARQPPASPSIAAAISFPLRGPASRSPSDNLSEHYRSTPIAEPDGGSNQHKGKKKKGKKRPHTRDDDNSGASDSASVVDQTITTRELMEMLPKRRKVFRTATLPKRGGKAGDSDDEEEREEAEEDASEAETDYERPTSRPVGKKTVAAGKSSRKPRKKKQRSSINAVNSETERRKEASRKKWAAVDEYELETIFTL
ncbi:hypothetical protein JCM11641_002979 [Rhodosporidiobolus odoratus]